VGVKVQLRWRQQPRWRRILAVALAIAGATLSAGLFLIMFDESDIRETGQPAVARVLEVRLRGKSPALADIRFVTTEGDTVLAEVDVDDADPFPDNGDLIDVRYGPEDPSGTVVVAHVDRVNYWINRLIWIPALSFIAILPACWAAGLDVRRRSDI
jgi:hypothetical protein